VRQRAGKKGIGFGSPIASKAERDIFADVQPKIFASLALIPEFIGRLPVIANVTELDRDALLEILTKPRTPRQAVSAHVRTRRL
jgi:ATP-dependent Clp protease ATP-binding subunit ClpX